MRKAIAFIAVAAAGGLVSVVFGGHAGAALRAQPVVEQNNPAFDPFQIELVPKSPFCGVADVPPGKRLVIEYVSARIEEAGSQTFTVTTTARGATVDHYIVFSADDGVVWVAGQPVHLYADPSSQVEVCSGGLGVATLSGYLVPLP